MLAKANNCYLFHKRKKQSLHTEPIAVVSLAFILALVKHSNYGSPLILDRLFFWLSKSRRAGVALSLRNVEWQIVILPLGSKNPEAVKKFLDKIGRRYFLGLHVKGYSNIMLQYD